MIWGIISLILLLVVIGLVIWLLVRGNNCPKKSALNQACLTTTDCNSGLVCSSGGGSIISGVTGATGTIGNVCKVAYGGVCFSNSECAAGQVCRNGICTIALGTQGKSCPCDVGFTCINNVCRAIVGQPCVNNGDCSTNICENNICVANSGGCTGFNPPSSCSSYSTCSSDSSSNYKTNSSDCHRKNRKESSDSSESCYLKNKKSKSRDSGSNDSHQKNDSNSRRSYDSLSDFYTCSDSNCSETVYSIDGKCHKHSYSSDSKKSSYESSSPTFSLNSSKCSSPYSSKKSSHESFECDKKCRKNCSSLNSDCSYSSNSHEKYLRRGVYVTNQQNVDQTLFTAIDQPIIDIVKTDKIYLLLANGNIVSNSGINNVIYVTNKKIIRMVRFNNDIVGLDKKGKLYYAVKSGTNIWTWEHLKNFPCDAIFITSTNAPSTNLEILTASDKAYLYTYSANWKEGVKTSKRKTCEPRYYGKDLTRYMDVNESTNVGKTNDGQKYRHVRAAGFYNTNVLVTVLTSDTFTHVRIIDNNAYFLFEQNC